MSTEGPRPSLSPNIHGIGPDTDGGPNHDYRPENTTSGVLVSYRDTPLKAAQRKAFDDPTVANLQELVEEAQYPLRAALQQAEAERDSWKQASTTWSDRHLYVVEQNQSLRAQLAAQQEQIQKLSEKWRHDRLNQWDADERAVLLPGAAPLKEK